MYGEVRAYYLRRGADAFVTYVVGRSEEQLRTLEEGWRVAGWEIVEVRVFPRPWPGVRRSVVMV